LHAFYFHPHSFKDIDLDRMAKFLEKADHYYFMQNISPKLHVFAPAERPGDSVVDNFFKTDSSVTEEKDKVESLRRAFEREMKKTEALDASPVNYPDDPLVVGSNLPAQTVDRMDLERMTTMLTAQQRRAEFWTKFSGMMTFIDTMFETVVRVTRATGRVDSWCSLVVMGNRNGVITFGRGKGPTPYYSMRRSIYKCRRNVTFVPMLEHRTFFQAVVAKWKRTKVLVKPQPRGFGLHASPPFFSMLEAAGFEDATIRRTGSNCPWNGVRAFFDCIRMQRSYRELALARGAHFQVMMDPFFKNPPVPTPAELRELEKDAAAAFTEAIQDVVRSRDLLATPAYAPLKVYFDKKPEFEAKMTEIFDAKRVPESMRMFPPFTQFLDTVAASGKASADKEAAEDAFDRAVEITSTPLSMVEVARSRLFPTSDPEGEAEDLIASFGPDDHDALRGWIGTQDAITAGFRAHDRPLAELPEDEDARPAGQRGFKHVAKPDAVSPVEADAMADYEDMLPEHDREEYETPEHLVEQRVQRLETLMEARLRLLLRAAPQTRRGSVSVPVGASTADAEMPLDPKDVPAEVAGTAAWLSATSARDLEKIVNHELVDMPRELAARATAVLSATSLADASAKMAELEALDAEYQYFPADAASESLAERFSTALERLYVDPYLRKQTILLKHAAEVASNFDRVGSPLPFGSVGITTSNPTSVSVARGLRRARRATSAVLRAETAAHGVGDVIDVLPADFKISETQMQAAIEAAVGIAATRSALRAGGSKKDNKAE
jgi:small subunit ribosomal protein S5